MSHWDYTQQKIVEWPTRLCESHPNWEVIDCGCCAGLQWGGESPRECNQCDGSGVLYRHIKSRVLATYPGGPFRGKDD